MCSLDAGSTLRERSSLPSGMLQSARWSGQLSVVQEYRRYVLLHIALYPKANALQQSEIRWRLRNTYDRQEVYDIVEYLLDEGYVRTAGRDISPEMVQTLDTEEEAELNYIASVSGTKKWYAAAT